MATTANNHNEDSIMEEQYELMEDSDVEATMPPNDLLRTAREFLNRPVTQQELARAWDKINHLPTEEQRVAACLEQLLLSAPTDKCIQQQGVGVASIPTVPKADSSSSPARTQAANSSDSQPAKSKISGNRGDRIIDISSSDNEDNNNNIGGSFPARSSPNHNSDRKRKRMSREPGSDDEVELPMSSLRDKGKKRARQMTPSAVPFGMMDYDDEDLLEDILRPDRVRNGSNSASSNSPTSKDSTATVPIAAFEGPEPVLQPLLATATQEEPSLMLQVLAVIPDVDSKHVQSLIEQHSATQENCVEHIIDILLNDKNYPKAQRASSAAEKGKAKESATEDALLARYNAYLDKANRKATQPVPAQDYREAALQHLFDEHPSIPMPFIRTTFYDSHSFWAPCHEELKRLCSLPTPGFAMLKSARKVKGKRAVGSEPAELTAERDCYFSKHERDNAEELAIIEEQKREQAEVAAGHTFECGCCFDDVAISKMIQCPEAHLFCMECARRNAENILGNRGCEITCMDQDGCTVPFTDTECLKFLKAPQLVLLEKIRSEKAVGAAGIAGLSYCPHCSYGCVIENAAEKLFYCMNEECMKVTCRKCQKPDHLPKSCEEYAADLKTDTIHKVEEAMTEALLKRCPKCSLPILKEDGCNKMTCTTCRILFCYVCSKHITGYDHFDQRHPSQPAPPTTSGKQKCLLWDDTRTREYEKVEEARKAAIAEIKAAKGDPDAIVTEEELTKLGLEKPPPKVYGQPQVFGGHHPGNAADQAHARILELREVMVAMQRGAIPANEANLQEMRERLAAWQQAAVPAMGNNAQAWHDYLARDHPDLLQAHHQQHADAVQRAHQLDAAFAARLAAAQARADADMLRLAAAGGGIFGEAQQQLNAGAIANFNFADHLPAGGGAPQPYVAVPAVPAAGGPARPARGAANVNMQAPAAAAAAGPSASKKRGRKTKA